MRALGVMAAVCAIAVPLASGGSQRATLHFVQFASGLSEPVFVTAPKTEPKNLYVVEQAGRIRVLVNGLLRTQAFLDIRSQVQSGGEQGLLSMAFHPSYATNHRFFVYFNARNGDIHVVEFTSNGTRALPGSARLLLVVRHRENANHNGGQLEFGPDGLLYAGTGDGGGEGDQHNYSQNLSVLLGKLLRLNVDKAGAKWQLSAYGLRNPWRYSFDRATGDLYIGDVGQDTWEEIDFRARAAALGKLTNYGWSVYEGRAKFKSARLTPGGKLVFPVTVYDHSSGDCSVTGGYVYRGAAVPAAKGRYFYGDYCSGKIWSLRISGGRAITVRREALNVSGLSSFGEDARGELYAVSLEGRIYKLAS